MRHLRLTFDCHLSQNQSKVEISQNFVVFSEHMNFISCSTSNSEKTNSEVSRIFLTNLIVYDENTE